MLDNGLLNGRGLLIVFDMEDTRLYTLESFICFVQSIILTLAYMFGPTANILQRLVGMVQLLRLNLRTCSDHGVADD